MNSSLLRQLWSVIENIQTGVLLRLNDAELVRQLMQQFRMQHALSSEEADVLSEYIRTKAHLIRDVASSRRVNGSSLK
jgi:hypothetical protein